MPNIELNTTPIETAVDPADIEYFVDVSEDALNQITTQDWHNSFAASTTEALTGTSAAKHATPDALAALWEQGADIASAATISVGEGGYFHITGTATITDIDFATDKAGRKVWLKFNGILTLTHHATTLVLLTGANIVTAAGDIACFISEGTDNVRCVSYTRASGEPLAGGAGITNSAGNNVIPKSDGTNLVASGFSDAGTNILQGETAGQYCQLSNANGTELAYAATSKVRILADQIKIMAAGGYAVDWNGDTRDFSPQDQTWLVDLGQSGRQWDNLYLQGYPILASHTPASATAAGVAGSVAWDASFIYICTATNTWKRVAIATW